MAGDIFLGHPYLFSDFITNGLIKTARESIETKRITQNEARKPKCKAIPYKSLETQETRVLWKILVVLLIYTGKYY